MLHALSIGLRRKLAFLKESLTGLHVLNLIFFRQAKAKCFGGHIWVPCNQGLRCTACLSVLKQYRLLSDLEVLASLPCPGAKTGRTGCGRPLLHKVHFTHTMDGTGIESTLTCCRRGTKLTGHRKGLSRKLLLPSRICALSLQRRRLWFCLQFFCRKQNMWTNTWLWAPANRISAGIHLASQTDQIFGSRRGLDICAGNRVCLGAGRSLSFPWNLEMETGKERETEETQIRFNCTRTTGKIGLAVDHFDGYLDTRSFDYIVLVYLLK